MAFGYLEFEHEILAQIELEHAPEPGMFERYTRCKPSTYRPGRAPDTVVQQPDYIRVELLNANGFPTWRWLLQFNEGNQAALDSCWQQLTTNPHVEINTLPWDHLINGDTGHTRVDGKVTGVVMY